MLDRVYGSPVSWPLPTMQSPSMAAHSPLINDPGPVLVQPTRFPDIPPPRARFRDPALLAQLYHHRAISEAGAMGHGLSKGALHANNALERLAAEGRVDHGHARTHRTNTADRCTSQMRSDARRDARWAAYLSPGDPRWLGRIYDSVRDSSGLLEWWAVHLRASLEGPELFRSGHQPRQPRMGC